MSDRRSSSNNRAEINNKVRTTLIYFKLVNKAVRYFFATISEHTISSMRTNHDCPMSIGHGSVCIEHCSH